MPKHIMLDLETMATTPNAAIVSIGAVRFNRGGVSEDTFYEVIDTDCLSDSYFKDPKTIAWWATQSPDAQKIFTQEGRIPIKEALKRFSEWIDDADTIVWGNGSDFDNVILTSAFRAEGLVAPWKFYNNRCFRTLKKSSPPIPARRAGTHHNALDDAIYQAGIAVKIWENSNKCT